MNEPVATHNNKLHLERIRANKTNQIRSSYNSELLAISSSIIMKSANPRFKCARKAATSRFEYLVLFLWLWSEASINYLYRFRIDHILWPTPRFCFHELKSYDSPIHNFLDFGHVMDAEGQEHSEKVLKPNRMASNNYMIFPHGRCVNKLAKFQHALQWRWPKEDWN